MTQDNDSLRQPSPLRIYPTVASGDTLPQNTIPLEDMAFTERREDMVTITLYRRDGWPECSDD